MSMSCRLIHHIKFQLWLNLNLPAMKKRFKLIFLFFWIGISLYPQETGYLSGFLKDRLTQDPLFGVKIKAGNHAALSDLDGFFELQLRPGEYPIQFSRYGMQTLTINGVIIPANDTVILDTALMPVPVAVAGSARVGDGRPAGGIRPLHGARGTAGCRGDPLDRRREGSVRAAHPRSVRTPGQPLLLHFAPVG